MKKIFLAALAAFSINQVAQATEPTLAEATIRQNVTTGKYEVFAKFDVSGEINIGGSMISVLLPAEANDLALVITPVDGGGWVDGSHSFNQNGLDYHGIFSNGASKIAYTVGTELKLFEFYTEAVGNVRLWELSKDAAQTADGTDYISNFYIPNTGFYLVPEIYGTTVLDVSGLDKNINAFNVSPNPAIDDIQLSIQNTRIDPKKEIRVKIFNTATSQEMILQKMAFSEVLKLKIGMLPAATYTVCILQEEQVLAQTLFVKITR